MVVQSGFVKAAFVFSTALSMALLTSALPAFAQVSSSEETKNVSAVTEAEAVPVADGGVVEEQIVSDEESEAAILEIAEVIMLDTHETDLAEINEIEAEKPTPTPGASELEGLTSTSLDLSSLTAESVPALKTALNSDNDLTQLYAADALWTLTGDSELVLPTLISAASSNNLSTRQLATAAIAHLGQRALPAIPMLNQLVGNSDASTRSLAQNALEIITSRDRPATTLGIIRREVRRTIIVPAAVRAINRLWQ